MLFLIPLIAFADDASWQDSFGYTCFDNGGQSNIASYCINFPTIKTIEDKQDNLKLVWVKYNLKNPVTIENQAYTKTVTYKFFDCNNNLTGLLSATVYDNDGNVVDNAEAQSANDIKMQLIPPGTIDEAIESAVCNYQK